MTGSLTTRIGWAVGLALATALVILVRAGAEAALVALFGALAAGVAAIRPDPALPAAAPVGGDTPIEPFLDAIASPVLLVSAGRVASANRAARALLGGHIVGEDVRVALRHPTAAARLAEEASALPDQPVELAGFGQRDERWLMHVTPVGPATRLVQLVDETGSHAAERMRTDFVANASHELRTPLASILGYVETLADVAGDDPAIRNRFLRIILDEARRMQRLVEDLISLSRIEAEKHRRPTAPVDLAALVAEVCDELRRAGHPRAADLACRTEPDLPPVAADRPQLSQLLHNLAGNALKYGRPDTPVTLAVAAGERRTVTLSVADEGEGIAPEHVPRLTERFYRVDAGRSRAMGGTGLGLAIVKHIVEHHRGRLDIASRVGAGTTVTVTLPAIAAPIVTPPLGPAVMKP